MRRPLLVLALLAGCAPAPAPAPARASAPAPGPVSAATVTPAPAAIEAVVFLVRHAETEPDGTRDPALSAAGRARAARLAGLLRDAGVDRVLTSPYARTRTTARAVAGDDRPVAEYDPSDLPALAARLRREGGRVLVVGHSNTTPELVRLLGGDPGPPIREDEHDRLYVLVPGGAGGAGGTVVLRY